jgi:hypothetical protein
MVQRLTVRQWAESLGMSKQAGYKAVERCEIPLVDGTLDPDVATMLYRKRTRTRTNKRHGSMPEGATAAGPAQMPETPSGDDYWQSRSRREKAEAELAELKLAEQRGELVRAADVRAAISKRFAALREAFLQLPSRVVPLLAAEPDPAKMDATLRAEIVGVLSNLIEAG